MELHEKLARWAGFQPSATLWIWWYPAGGATLDEKDLPNFSEDLNAEYVYIVPKLQEKGHMVELYAYEHKGFFAQVYSVFQSAREPEEYYEPIADAKGDKPALALFEAVEQVINQEEEGNATNT